MNSEYDKLGSCPSPTSHFFVQILDNMPTFSDPQFPYLQNQTHVIIPRTERDDVGENPHTLKGRTMNIM